MHTYAYTHTHVHLHNTHICMHIHTNIHTHLCAHMYKHSHIYIYMLAHTCTHIYAYSSGHTHAHICVNAHMQKFLQLKPSKSSLSVPVWAWSGAGTIEFPEHTERIFRRNSNPFCPSELRRFCRWTPHSISEDHQLSDYPGHLSEQLDSESRTGFQNMPSKVLHTGATNFRVNSSCPPTFILQEASFPGSNPDDLPCSQNCRFSNYWIAFN